MIKKDYYIDKGTFGKGKAVEHLVDILNRTPRNRVGPILKLIHNSILISKDIVKVCDLSRVVIKAYFYKTVPSIIEDMKFRWPEQESATFELLNNIIQTEYKKQFRLRNK